MRCEHQFQRFRRWPVKLRWRCIHCGEITRLYDGVDAMGTRPIHPHMSVAVKGFNTVKRSQQRQKAPRPTRRPGGAPCCVSDEVH